MALNRLLDAEDAYEVARSYARLYDLAAKLAAAQIARDTARVEYERTEAEVKELMKARAALIVEVVPYPIRVGEAAAIAGITNRQVGRLARGD